MCHVCLLHRTSKESFRQLNFAVVFRVRYGKHQNILPTSTFGNPPRCKTKSTARRTQQRDRVKNSTDYKILGHVIDVKWLNVAYAFSITYKKDPVLLKMGFKVFHMALYRTAIIIEPNRIKG